MKRVTLIIVSTVLAASILFGSLMSQTSTAHAASFSNSSTALKALIAKIEQHVHVVNHHATIDSQLKDVVTQQQLQTAQLAVSTYNKLTDAHQQRPNSHEVSKTIASSAHPMDQSYCLYLSKGDMDNIAWSMIFGGGIITIAGIIVALFTAGWGAALLIAGVIVGIGGTYLLWENDTYWANGTTWCTDLSSVWYYVN